MVLLKILCRFHKKLKCHSVKVTQSCLTLCDPMHCSPPGSSVHGILQARMLEWVAIPFSRASSQPRDQTQVSCIVGRFFTLWAIREALKCHREKCLVRMPSELTLNLLALFIPFMGRGSTSALHVLLSKLCCFYGVVKQFKYFIYK